MAIEKPLTKDDIRDVLKEIGVATKDDLLHLEQRLKLRMGKHRNEIFAMFGKLATSTPSRREFTELKLRA